MVDQVLHSLHKLGRAWQFGVPVIRRFVDPARMEVKQLQITGGDKYVDGVNLTYYRPG
jgi:hypothetical protein